MTTDDRTNERNDINEAVQESEEKYRVLVEMTDTGFVILDGQGRVLDANAEYVRLSGHAELDEIRGRSVVEWTAPHDRERNAAEIGKCLEQGFVRNLDIDYVHEDGRIVPVELNATVMGAGAELRIFGLCRDIAGRKQAEESLRESEERYRQLFEAESDAIFLIDNTTGSILNANTAAADMYGYTVKELLTKKNTDLSAEPSETQRVTDETPVIKENKVTVPLRYHRKKDGTVIPVEITGRFFNYQGRPVHIAAIRDIGERRRAEEALRESERRFRGAFENAAVGASMVDLTGRFIKVNRFLCEMLGYSEEELLGKTFSDVTHPDDVWIGLDFLKRQIAGEVEFASFEKRYFRKDGSIVHLIISPAIIRNEQGAPQYFVGLFQDITERKLAEEELSKHREQLEHLVVERTVELQATNETLRREIIKREAMEQEIIRSQKLEALGILAGGIAHDFNNMLASIMNHISLAMLDLDPSQEPYRQIEGAERATLRARDLTQQLLTFSRGGAPVRKVVQIGTVIAEAAGFALRGARARSELEIPGDLWAVNADEGQISQVIHNLVINADQSMPHGGIVSVRCQNVTLDDRDHLPLRPGRYVLISVSDSGSGIAKEHHGRIFDPYFTTKQKGSGLGLATTYSIVTKHEGHISLESELGRGSTFRIYLPASVETGAVLSAAEGRPVRGTGHVLVMDDDDSVRTTCGDILTRLGYTPFFARDGAEAVDLFRAARERGEPIDLVILDLTVPGGMGGAEAMEQLLRIDPKIKAIVSSGYSNDPVMADHSAYGFCGIVSKPYRIAELSRVLHEVLAGVEEGG